MPRPGFLPNVTVWTKPGNASGDRRFFAGATALRSADVKSVLAAIEMYASQGDLTAEFAYQESDDGIVWPAWNVFTSLGTILTIAADGVVFDPAWLSMSPTKGFVRPGFAVRNTTGNPGITQHALLSLRFDTRSC